VTKETLKPYDWIKKIPASLAELDDVPLLGHPPEFPWQGFIDKLSRSLEIQDLDIQPSELKWRDVDELFSGLGDPLIPLNFSVAPFDGKIYWAIAKEDIKGMMSLMLLKGGSASNVLEEEYQHGFYHFLALEVMHTIEALGFDSDLKPQIIKSAELPNSPTLCMDITITAQGKTIVGRLFISPEFRKSMAEHYTKQAQETPYKSPLAEKLEVTLHLEAGSTTLTQEEWSKVKPGDFLILDKCSLQPGTPKGKVMMTLGGHPFFRGKIKDGNVKILEHPLYREVK